MIALGVVVIALVSILSWGCIRWVTSQAEGFRGSIPNPYIGTSAWPSVKEYPSKTIDKYVTNYTTGVFCQDFYNNFDYADSSLVYRMGADQKLKNKLSASSPERKIHPEWFDKETGDFIGTMTDKQKKVFFKNHHVQEMITIAAKQSNALICGMFTPSSDITPLRVAFQNFPNVLMTDKERNKFHNAVFPCTAPLEFVVGNKNGEDTLTYTFKADGSAFYGMEQVDIEVAPTITIDRLGTILSVSPNIYSKKKDAVSY